jgi:hypothetical protein
VAPGPGCGECTLPRTGPGDMPLALRLSDGLGGPGGQRGTRGMPRRWQTLRCCPEGRTGRHCLRRAEPVVWRNSSVKRWAGGEPLSIELPARPSAFGSGDARGAPASGMDLVLRSRSTEATLPAPNVRANRTPAAGRQARAGENVPCTARPGLVARRWCSG